MKPEIGCRVHETVFEPSDFVTQQLLKAYLRDAAAPEPRASLAAISVEADGDQMTAKTTIQFKGFTDEIFDATLSLTTTAA
jgi:phage baseplate assembly protein W